MIAKRPLKFQFSLLTLLAAVALAGLVCAHLAVQANIVRSRRALLAEIKNLDGWFVDAASEARRYQLRMGPAPTTVPTVRAWLGDQAIQVIVLTSASGAETIKRYSTVFPEASVYSFNPLDPEKIPSRIEFETAPP